MKKTPKKQIDTLLLHNMALKFLQKTFVATGEPRADLIGHRVRAVTLFSEYAVWYFIYGNYSIAKFIVRKNY